MTQNKSINFFFVEYYTLVSKLNVNGCIKKFVNLLFLENLKKIINFLQFFIFLIKVVG